MIFLNSGQFYVALEFFYYSIVSLLNCSIVLLLFVWEAKSKNETNNLQNRI